MCPYLKKVEKDRFYLNQEALKSGQKFGPISSWEVPINTCHVPIGTSRGRPSQVPSPRLSFGPIWTPFLRNF